MKIHDLKQAKEVYRRGGNVTEHLRSVSGADANSSEIIEIAYDLQAGTYIDAVNRNLGFSEAYAGEIHRFLEPYLTDNSTFLDVGTGELTTLSLILKNIEKTEHEVFAFDISWSRLFKGRSFAEAALGEKMRMLNIFVSDMKELPLPSRSMEIVFSSHALEPNGGQLGALLPELFRVCRGHLVLFEPSYELNSDEGRARMDRLGYIKGLESAVNALGGSVVDVTLLKNVANPLNPTACYVVKPGPSPEDAPGSGAASAKYTVPGTDHPLVRKNGFWFSEDTGLVFAELEGIPVLKSETAILASALV